jgi:magnesium-transporting ATPase (P-type)
MDAGQGIGRFLRRFSHRDGEIEPSQNAAPRTGTLTEDIPAVQESEAALDVAESVVGQRLRTTLVRWLTPIEELPENLDQPAESTEEETQVLLAYLPKAVSFYDRKGRPDLPDDLIPLTRVQVNETIRPEAKQTLKALFDEGIQIKILAADPPEKVLPIIKALEIPEEQIRMVSGTDLPEKTDLAKAIPETLIFTNLTPAQKAEVVKSSQLQESYTMMIGSEVSDVLALRQAYLGVTTRSGAQAVLQQADIVLLDESIAALPRVFSEGQRMINGVLITFKLQISKVLMQLLLICFLLFNILDYFPYLSAQAGVASVFTITIPNIFLVVWASARRLTQESMRRQLLRFIIPVALSITILVSMIFTYFDEGTGDPAYANLAVTYALLLAGWLRVLFVLPPHRIWTGGTELRGDLRVYRVVLGSALPLIGFLIFPFFQDSFKISLLASWGDFFIVVMAIIAWAMILRIIWRLGSRE